MTSLDPNYALPPLKSFSLTHILYDPSHPLSVPLTLLSLSPIFLFVSCFTLIIFNRKLSVLLLALGSVLNEVLSWGLKRVFKGERPYLGFGEIGNGYGMPSSHSQAAAFLVAWGVGHSTILPQLCLQSANAGNQATGERVGRAERIQTIRLWRTRIYLLGLVLWSLGVSYSRWHLLYHTPVQIIAGYSAGLLAGTVYFVLTEYIPLQSPSSISGRIRSTIEELWVGLGGMGGWEVGSSSFSSGGWGEGWVFGLGVDSESDTAQSGVKRKKKA